MDQPQLLLEFLRSLNDEELTALIRATYKKDSRYDETIELIISSFFETGDNQFESASLFEAENTKFDILVLLLQSALLAVTTARLIQKNTARESNCWN